MNLRPALTAALELLGDVDATYVTVYRDTLIVSIHDGDHRRTVADEIGADTSGPDILGHVDHRAVLTTDAGEIRLRITGRADAEDRRRPSVPLPSIADDVLGRVGA